MPHLTTAHRPDGLVIVTFDAPDSPANIFDAATLAELEAVVDALAADAQVRGIIFTSAKAGIFIAGADIKALAQAEGTALRQSVETGQRLFQKIADLRVPTAAAIHGACLGGGLELALACDWRVASPDHATRIGLPETQLGILPAWGGSTRLPRLIGLPKALDLILAGKQLAPKLAKKLGVIDDLAPRERLIDRCAQFLATGKARRPRHALSNNRLAAAIVRDVSESRVVKKTRGNYPAVEAALDVVTQSVSRSLPDSLAAERDTVIRLANTPEAEQLIRVFLLQEHAKKAQHAPGIAAAPIHRTAVIGAGVMGAGIAQWLSSREIPVLLQDIDPARVAAGMNAIAKVYAGGVKRHLFTAGEARRLADHVMPSADRVPLTGVDLVIEAAVERLDVKKKIFADLCARSRPDTVLATNTSALPIAELSRAEGITHPERIVGLHFFNPVHLMRLVEIVVIPDTSEETIATALAFVRRIGKLPVVVKDSPGFLVNRILMPYLIEAGRLFDQGVNPQEIDAAMLDFGMPMGPIRLLDEVGLDVALHVAETMIDAFGERFAVPATLQKLVEAGHTGRKSGRGFYVYHGEKTTPNPEALALRWGRDVPSIDRAALAERLALLMTNESFRVLEEKVAESADDIDFAMILGTGYAPFRGGPMTWAQRTGLGKVKTRLESLAATDGQAYAPAASLVEAARVSDQTLLPRRSNPVSSEWGNGGSPGAPASSGPPTSPETKDDAGRLLALPAVHATTPQAAMNTPPPDDSPTPSVIDTSKMSTGERAALELAESSRVAAGPRNSFAGSLFMGNPDFSLLFPFPEQSPEDKAEGDAFLAKLETFLQEKVDPDAIDATGEIPDDVIQGLAELGAFGIKIPKEYGGLGLSQTNYSRAAMVLGRYCGNLTALLSAHQSIGVPQPLLVFGTPEQKAKFLPRCAKGEISAFALTEPDVGSDPAKMSTTARLSDHGTEYILNGEKLWCTNVVKAGVIVVMAKMPESTEGRPKISAFIVEMDTPGITVTHRCRFMGLRALYNGVVTFQDVRVPRENLIAGEGRGLKVALTTLNTGRITLPAACAGMARQCLEWCTDWAAKRVQWGQPIGKHEAIADKLRRMERNTRAIEAMVRYVSALVDQDKNADIRIEAAMAKLWGTEKAWEIVNDTMQIRGGRGYETGPSLAARGEPNIPVERMMRDCRINTIFEGSSEIMRLFIAREALDPHLKIGGPVLNTTLPTEVRLKAALNAAWRYALWYPRLWIPYLTAGNADVPKEQRAEVRRIRNASRRLARRLFHAMLRHGPKLDKRQVLLGRFVDEGAELLARAVVVGERQ
ncbi:MAG: acyl-CoA dehydrogenase family protein [Verrucomicrobiales bacterium]|nr:acyl-CoA dehydrogenase family protein [Verrucomicrobiales bacterium]